MPAVPIRAAIFDLDGALTQPFFDFDAIRAEMGIDANVGPVLEAMERMTPEKRHACEQILHRHESRAVSESRLNKGVRQTLEVLRQAGIRIGVLTRNKRANAIAVAEKHHLEFDFIVDREAGPVKPDAFGVLRICREFAVAPKDALVVGDYLFDVLCAKSAGALAVLLVNNSRAAEFAEQADFVIESIDQVLDIVNEKNQIPCPQETQDS
jgi:HAD superfamily hydrolase (TIGR01509 family)